MSLRRSSENEALSFKDYADIVADVAVGVGLTARDIATHVRAELKRIWNSSRRCEPA
jgi:hypothetical protein